MTNKENVFAAYCGLNDIRLVRYYTGIPDIRRIIYAPPATIVFWEDDTKTVVKCEDDRAYSVYDGLCAAVAKKYFGSNSAIKKCIAKKGDFSCKGGKHNA